MDRERKIWLLLCLMIAAWLSGNTLGNIHVASMPYRFPEKALQELPEVLEDMVGWHEAEEELDWLSLVNFTSKDLEIVLYVNGFQENGPAKLQNIMDPKKAERLRECQVGEVTGTFYAKDGQTYLWWQPDGHTAMLIEFDAETVTEEEVLRMAVSTVR